MTDSPQTGDTLETAPPPGNTALTLARLSLAGVVLVAIGLVLLWQAPSGGPAMTRGQLDTIGAKLNEIDTLAERVNALASKPAQTTDLGPLTSRVEALEKRPEPAQVNLAPIESRLAALEGRPVGASPADIAGLATRLDGFAQRTDQIAQREQTDVATLGGKLDDATRQLAALGARLDAASADSGKATASLAAKVDAANAETAKTLAALTARVDALDQRLGKLETDSSQITTLAAKTGKLARLQAAQAALVSGQPLGDVPGAPPAVAKFAHDAPPTIASLRLSYPTYEAAAQKASLPNTGGDHALVDRMWARMQQTVTVRQGDDLLVGNPAGGVLAQARSALDAGDLQGAVNTLAALTGPPLDAMKPWLDQAHALLDAQAALATLEGQS